jgi:hypothetical protein
MRSLDRLLVVLVSDDVMPSSSADISRSTTTA